LYATGLTAEYVRSLQCDSLELIFVGTEALKELFYNKGLILNMKTSRLAHDASREGIPHQEPTGKHLPRSDLPPYQPARSTAASYQRTAGGQTEVKSLAEDSVESARMKKAYVPRSRAECMKPTHSLWLAYTKLDHSDTNIRYNILTSDCLQDPPKRSATDPSININFSKLSRSMARGKAEKPLSSQKEATDLQEVLEEVSDKNPTGIQSVEVSDKQLDRRVTVALTISKVLAGKRISALYKNEKSPMLEAISRQLTKECLKLLLKKPIKLKEVDAPQQTFDLEEELRKYKPDMSVRLTLQELLEASCASKSSSMETQAYLSHLPAEELEWTGRQFLGYFAQLSTDKYGNYIVQFLILKCDALRPEVARLMNRTFHECLTNEFSSRIIQTLCLVDRNFFQQSLEKFREGIDALLENITGAIMLSKLISVCRDDTMANFTLDMLETNKDYLRKAYFNRMLSTLVSCCSEAVLNTTFAKVKDHFWLLMNDKFGNYTLQVFLERNHKEAIKLLLRTCLKNYTTLLVKKYPKFLLIKLIELGGYEEFLRSLVNRLVVGELDALVAVFEKKESSYLFTLIVSRFPSECISQMCSKLQRLLQSVDLSRLPLRR
jgi:hypothetical protein